MCLNKRICRILALLLTTTVLLISFATESITVSAEDVQVLTADQFVACLYKALNRKTAYNNQYPYNLGYYDGDTITWDCWNLGKSIIWSKGAIVDNYTPGTRASIDTSCGLGDWTGLTIIKKAPNCNGDFSNLIPGEWLYLDGHTGYYVGDGQVIECTAGWNAWCVTQSQIDKDGNRSKDGVGNGKWLYHGMVPWIDYSAYSYLTPSNDPVGAIERCIGGDGYIDITGWMYDPDKDTAFLPFQVYIGGLPGSQDAEVHTGYYSDLLREDINTSYGITGNHGYYIRVYTDKKGLQTVYIYALNVYGGGEDTLIGYAEADVTGTAECLHSNTEVRNAVTPTCTNGGYTGDVYCRDCGIMIAEGSDLSPLTHILSDWITDKSPQPGEAGQRHKECTLCYMVIQVEPIPPLDEPVNEHSPQAAIESKTIKPGETVTLAVELKNVPEIKSMAAANVSYDSSALTLEKVEWTVTGAMLFRWNADKGNGVVSYGSLGDRNGKVLELTFKVKDDAPEKDYYIGIEYQINSGEENVTIATNPGTLTVKSYTPGDLDGDGRITDEDAIYLLFYIFFPEEYPVDQPIDYDGDGRITDEDAIYLLFYTFFPEDYPIK